MTWLNEDIAKQWREEGQRYARDIIEYARIGHESNWQQAQEEPLEDRRATIAPLIVEMIQKANEAADFKQLRAVLPTASWPLIAVSESKTQAIKPITLLNSGDAIVQAETGVIYLVSTETITELPAFRAIGVSPDKQLLALLDENELRVVKGWQTTEEQTLAILNWATILQQINALHPATIQINRLRLENIIPFDEGNKLLLISSEGIYLLANDTVECLYPEPSSHESDEISLDMAHGTVSKNGRWLAYGCQASEHILKDLQDGTIYKFEPESSYPHYALFSHDEENIWFNACHFYNGITMCVPLAEAIAKGKKGQFADWPITDENIRVYTGIALKEGQLLGDAYGYIRLINDTGEEVWNYFVGSTIAGMTISEDHQQLVVGTYGGFLHFIDLNQKELNEYQIGNANITETGSWILFKNEKPLRW